MHARPVDVEKCTLLGLTHRTCSDDNMYTTMQETLGPILSKLQSLLSSSKLAGGVVLLEGEGGIGKSRVMAALRAAGLPEGTSGHLLFGRAEAATKSRVLQRAWRLFASLPCTAMHLLFDTYCSPERVRLNICRCCTLGEMQSRLFVGMTWLSLPMH